MDPQFTCPSMNTDQSTIEQHCVEAIELAKQALTNTNVQEAESARDTCIEARSGAKSLYDALENEMDDLRKQSRHLADLMADLKKDQRRWKAYMDDLQELSRRSTNQFWELKREAQAFNQKV